MKTKWLNNNCGFSKKAINLFLFDLIALFPLICFILPHYAYSSYGIVGNYQQHIFDFLGSMRYFGALIIRLWTSFFDPLIDPRIDIIVYIVLNALIIAVFSIFLLNKMENKDKWNLLIINTSVILSVSNIWINDILTFPECIFLLSIGNVLCFLSIILFFEKKIKVVIRYIVSGALLVCATAVYQQYLVIFIIYSVLITGIDTIGNAGDSKKKTILTYIGLISFGIISELIYYIIGKWLQIIWNIAPNSRIATSLDVVVQNIYYFFTHQHSFLKGRGFFNTEILTLSYALIVLIWVVSLILYVKKNKVFFWGSLYFLSCFAAYCSSYFMGLISTSKGTRTMFGLFSVFALFSVGAVNLINKRMLKYILSIILVFLYALNMIKTVEMSINQYQINSLDIEDAKIYINEIEKYEAKNKTSINKIEFCQDANLDRGSMSALNQSEFFCDVLHFVSDRKFLVSEMSDNQHKHFFSSHDWIQCDPENQLIFEKNIVYICLY